jgi:hypothetical protein
VKSWLPCNYNFVAAGATISSESFLPANGAIDPGENVSVNFTLANLGTQPTLNTSANLNSSGGVTNPNGPMNYGAFPANGGGVRTRSFSFRADPSSLVCGGSLVATQQILKTVSILAV